MRLFGSFLFLRGIAVTAINVEIFSSELVQLYALTFRDYSVLYPAKASKTFQKKKNYFRAIIYEYFYEYSYTSNKSGNGDGYASVTLRRPGVNLWTSN